MVISVGVRERGVSSIQADGFAVGRIDSTHWCDCVLRNTFGQNVAAFVDLLVGERHGRQQADHGLLRAVDQQAALQALLDDRRAFDRQLQADHQPADPQFFDDRQLVDQRRAAAGGIARRVASARSSKPSLSIVSIVAMPARAAIGLPPNVAACMPGRRLGAISAVVNMAAPGDAAAQALGQRHDIGRHAGMLIGEPFAGAAAAALHFVEDQQQPCSSASSRKPLQETRPAECGCRLRPAPARSGWRTFRRRRAFGTASKSPNGA